jgi:hypothetical protein
VAGVSVDQVLQSSGGLLNFVLPFYQLAMVSPIATCNRLTIAWHGAKVSAFRWTMAPTSKRLRQRQTKRLNFSISTTPKIAGPCSVEKREKLAALANRHGFWLLEDAPYRPLRFRGKVQPSLYELNPQMTLHMLSVSKLIGPGPRVGILYGPADVKGGQIAEILGRRCCRGL